MTISDFFNFDSKAPLKGKSILLWIAISAASFHLASASSWLLCFLPLYFIGLAQLSRINCWKLAFYSGLLHGMLIYSWHLRFFWRLFKQGAIGLWLVLAIWTGLFLLCAHMLRRRYSSEWLAVLLPITHFVIEYVRCELNPLKFTWGISGWMGHLLPQKFPQAILGVYGCSLLLFVVSLTLLQLRHKNIRTFFACCLCALLIGLNRLPASSTAPSEGPLISGIQLEFPTEKEALTGLEKTRLAHPETDLFFLPEYCFNSELYPEMIPGGVPESVRNWCRTHKKYLLAGTKLPLPGDKFKNTAIVIGPDGKTAFTQTKCNPIQFFKDGIPAKEQKLWNSPWGKIGIAICYDLSYTRVIDNLVEQGAQALLIPTMDVTHWGESQHELHSRIGPSRAAEYGLPIYKVASSGISQFIGRNGEVLTSAPFPGQGEILSSRLQMAEHGRLPVDRFLFWPLLLFIFFALGRKEDTLPADKI